MKAVNGIFLPDGEVHFAECPGLGALYPSLATALPHLKRRRTAIDVGAHVGLWSRWLQQEFHTVHAFEPVREFAKMFRKNVTGRNVLLHQHALGASFGRVAMKVNPADTGQTHISGHGHIPLWPLDCYRLSNVDLIKIDVEGYEIEVVRGAARTIMENMPVIIVEERGLDSDNFAYDIPGGATCYLQGLGMKLLERVGSDNIMGWP